MALNMAQIKLGAIVDRITEWGEDGKERPLQTIKRGIIVKIIGDEQTESYEKVFVCFSPNDKDAKDTVKVNDIEVPCRETKAAELSLKYPADSTVAREAWRRLFQIPVNVGFQFEDRKHKASGKRKVEDQLQLTPAARSGPVEDDQNPKGMRNF
jgi:hypothetical protein